MIDMLNMYDGHHTKNMLVIIQWHSDYHARDIAVIIKGIFVVIIYWISNYHTRDIFSYHIGNTCGYHTGEICGYHTEDM